MARKCFAIRILMEIEFQNVDSSAQLCLLTPKVRLLMRQCGNLRSFQFGSTLKNCAKSLFSSNFQAKDKS